MSSKTISKKWIAGVTALAAVTAGIIERGPIGLWWAGVRSFESPSRGLHGLVADKCPRSAKRGANCACVAFFHGVGDDSQGWLSVLRIPHPDRYFFAPDLPGAGRSAKPSLKDGGYSAKAMAKTLRAELAERCPKWTLVGNDFGAWIAMSLALDWKEGVEKLLLVSPIGLYPSDLKPWLDTLGKGALKEFYGRAYARPVELKADALAKLTDRMARVPVAEISKAQSEAEALAKKPIKEYEGPVELVWGASDQLVPPPAENEGFRRALPQAVFHTLPLCGHYPQKECPIAFEGAVLDILKRTLPGAPPTPPTGPPASAK